MRLSHLPMRLATGAFIANSGAEKLGADDETAKRLHQRAAAVYPFLERLDPRTFVRLLALGELALGGALLTPAVSARTAGLGLTAFSGALLRVYLKTPGMTKQDGFRPTAQGVPLAKDVWMLGIGLGLLLDPPRRRKKSHKPNRSALTRRPNRDRRFLR
ncbi:MAG: hypothetical protein IRZ02_00115 [Acidothermus sp.]|nr:hypothetical protein [Acidothermus sp.]MCL6537414.1 hypothetical protein [Acidothermus sp.]